MLHAAAMSASHCHCMFPGGTRDVLQKGAILPSAHTPLAPQSSKPTSFSSCVSPASVVVLVTKQTGAARQLWIKIHWARKPGYFHPEWIPVLVPCPVLAEGRERVRAGSREVVPGWRSSWAYQVSWMVSADTATPEHSKGSCSFILAKRAPALWHCFQQGPLLKFHVGASLKQIVSLLIQTHQYGFGRHTSWKLRLLETEAKAPLVATGAGCHLGREWKYYTEVDLTQYEINSGYEAGDQMWS